MDKQLVMNEFLESKSGDDYVSLYNIYHLIKNKYSELYNVSELIDELRDNLSPITYDMDIRHSLYFDNKDKVYRYKKSVICINEAVVSLDSCNNVLFSTFNTNISNLYLISNFVNENKNKIEKILSIYKKYYFLFDYDNNEIGNALNTYYLDDNTYIVVYADGCVKLFSDYKDISNDEVSRFMKVNVEDKAVGYNRKLMLTKD